MTSDFSKALFDKANSMASILRRRACETCEARRIPAATLTDFWNAGLFSLLKPKKFGGAETPIDTVYRLAGVLARGDASAAWVWNLFAMHDYLCALLPEKAQQEFWAKEKVLALPASPPTDGPPRSTAASSSPANGRFAAALIAPIGCSLEPSAKPRIARRFAGC